MADVQHIVPIIPWEEITLGKKLGEGGFGIVFQGDWKHGGTVAIKQIKGVLGDDAARELKAEAGVMAALNSPYIVRLFGLCWEDQKYAMVMELMPNASLYNLLHSKQEIPWNLRYKIAQDIAFGLRLLHARKILHRDMKSLNVLLDNNFNAKLTDFGLAKVKTHSQSTSKIQSSSVGTIAWMAPELLSLSPKYSESSDVYGYGITTWELAAREIPYHGVEASVLKDEIKKGERAEIPADCPETFADLIKSCWSHTPAKRPTMDMVVTALSTLIKAEAAVEPVQTASLSSSVYQDVGLSSLGVVTQAKASTSSTSSTSNYQDISLSSLGIITQVKASTSPNQLLFSKEVLPPPYTPPTKVRVEKLESAAPTIFKTSSVLVDKSASKKITEYEKGIKCYAKCQYKKALDYFLKISLNQGHPQYLAACLSVWNIYTKGKGVGINVQQAEVYGKIVANNINWFEEQANSGEPRAQTNLAIIYSEGLGGTQNFLKAQSLYKKASRHGYAEAQNNLGFMYYSGQLGSQDDIKARELFEKAALHNYAEAQNNLGNLYRNGEGVTINYIMAKECYQKAAAQGLAEAQNNLGTLYYVGSKEIPLDYAQAKTLFEQAAAQDYAYAQRNLGLMHYNAQGVTQNYNVAFALYEKAAKQGYAAAQYSLGLMYYNGKVTVKNEEKALEWLEKAAAQEYAPAQEALSKLVKPKSLPKVKLIK